MNGTSGTSPGVVLPRTIDPRMDDDNNSIDKNTDSSSSTPLDPSSLPLPCREIPTGTRGLRECAAQEISHLEQETGGDDDALDDGFVLCDLSVVERKLYAWRRLFPRIKPFFALKCNPDVMVAAVLGRHASSVGYDCASLAEIRLALQSCRPCQDGVEKPAQLRCIYANPQRADGDLRAALDLQIGALTFDGAEELYKVHRAYQGQLEAWQRQGSFKEQPPLPPEMILRLLVPDTYSTVPLGEKFGAPPQQVQPLTKLALELKLPLIGVSFHCGSGCHDPQAYGNAIWIAHEAMKEMNQLLQDYHASHDPQELHYDMPRRCNLLDIGGGFPGFDGDGGDDGRFCGAGGGGALETATRAEDHVETAAKIAAVVTPLLNQLFPPNDEKEQDMYLISEPGRYFVEAAFSYCARIYSVRVEKDLATAVQERRHYYIAQGVHGLFKDVILCGESFVPLALPLTQQAGDDAVQEEEGGKDEHSYPSTVHGPSGEDFDVVCPDCPLPRLQVGDWLLFDRMGAYTLSIAARSGSLPLRYVMGA